MSSALANAHIAGQAQLRQLVTRSTGAIWDGLPAYNDTDVDQWLATVLPVIAAAMRQSITLTDAFIARTLGRAPLGVDAAHITDLARPGAAPEDVYRRPFVTVWAALKAGTAFEAAIAAGRARATSAAAMDVQLAMRTTLTEIGQADDAITGYQRVADAGACAFCLEVDGAKVAAADPMPLHNGCGCGVDVLTEPFTPTGPPDTVAVHEHGELGPVLGDPAHGFTEL